MYNPHTPMEILFEILFKDSLHWKLSLIFLLVFSNKQHYISNSGLFCSTVASGRLAHVFLALPLLVGCLHCLYKGRCHLAPGAVASKVNPRLAPGSLE
jgi:hypothetical protein